MGAADEDGGRDEDDELDRAAILSRRQRLLVTALAGIAVGGGACRDPGASSSADPPTMTANPVPSACLEYLPPAMSATAPTAAACLSVAIPIGPSVTPTPCLRPISRPPPMTCLSIAPAPPTPTARPHPCLGPSRPPTTRYRPGEPVACLSVDPLKKPSTDADPDPDEAET